MAAVRDEEKELKEFIGMLESLSSKTLTMQDLEIAFHKCTGSHIAMVFLADMLFRIVKMDLQELCCEIESLQESLVMKREPRTEDDEIQEENSVKKEGDDHMYADVYVDTIVRWIEGGVQPAHSIAWPVLRCLLLIASALSRVYANPCNLEMGVGKEAILTWRELQSVALTFLSIARPRIVDALPVIRCLRRKPILDCRDLSPEERLQLTKFDRKWERLCSLYPVVNMLADPPLVVVEPVGGGALPAQVAAIVDAISSATNNPLPSGVGVPVRLADVEDYFTHIFQLQSIEDARAFAAMLRVQLRDARGGGGPGPAVRIVSLSATPASLRIY